MICVLSIESRRKKIVRFVHIYVIFSFRTVPANMRALNKWGLM